MPHRQDRDNPLEEHIHGSDVGGGAAELSERVSVNSLPHNVNICWQPSSDTGAKHSNPTFASRVIQIRKRGLEYESRAVRRARVNR